MLLRSKSDARPYHLGTYPLEVLPRDPGIVEIESRRAPVGPPAKSPPPQGPLARSLRDYLGIYVENALRKPAPAKAPVPDDPHRRMIDVKGYSYFMNATQVGICRIPENAWCLDSRPFDHEVAVVLLLAHGRIPESNNPARAWIEPAIVEAADSRIGGIAVCLAGHISQLGWSAEPHVMGAGSVDPQRLAVLAGLALRGEKPGELRNPFVDGFSLAVVTTDYALEPDFTSGIERSEIDRPGILVRH